MTDTDRDFTKPPTTGAQINERCAMVIGPPVTLEHWRAKAEAPPGPGVQALMSLIAEDCTEVTTEHIDGNTLVQKICIKGTDRIAQMAREAGLIDCENSFGQLIICQGPYNKELAAFARLVAEDCAKVAEQTTEYGALDMHGETLAYATAQAIRARYSKEG
jgi:hypothetical protein